MNTISKKDAATHSTRRVSNNNNHFYSLSHRGHSEFSPLRRPLDMLNQKRLEKPRVPKKHCLIGPMSSRDRHIMAASDSENLILKRIMLVWHRMTESWPLSDLSALCVTKKIKLIADSGIHEFILCLISSSTHIYDLKGKVLLPIFSARNQTFMTATTEKLVNYLLYAATHLCVS